MSRIIAAFALFAPLLACTPDYSVDEDKGTVGGDDTAAPGDDAGDVEEPDHSEWDGATIVILSPASGAFLPWGEDNAFEAVVYDADGEPTDWDEVTWASTEDAAWGPTGASFTDADLDVGRHTLRAVAVLPNGDQLTDAVGGVLVQHEDAGVYAGNMIVDATGEYEGTPITASCVGAAVITVDAYGEVAEGDSSCVLSVMGYDQEAAHAFSLEVGDGGLEGEASLDLSFFEVGFDVTGEVGGGVLTASWADNVYGLLDLEGDLEVERVTRDLWGE